MYWYINAQGIFKKNQAILGMFPWAVPGKVCWLGWLWHVPCVPCRPTVAAWHAAAVTWTPRVPCVAPAAPPRWRSSTMPLCWSAWPSWIPASILSCHSQMVSTAPGGCLGLGQISLVQPDLFIWRYFWDQGIDWSRRVWESVTPGLCCFGNLDLEPHSWPGSQAGHGSPFWDLALGSLGL